MKLFDKIRKALKLYEQVEDVGIRPDDLLDKLCNIKQFIMIGEGSDNKPVILDSGKPETEFLADCREVIKDIVIRRIGREQYDMNIDRMDSEVGMLFRESDYHMARAEYLDAELRYYKEANSPQGLGGNQLMNMWQRVLETKRVFEEIEKEVQMNN